MASRCASSPSPDAPCFRVLTQRYATKWQYSLAAALWLSVASAHSDTLNTCFRPFSILMFLRIIEMARPVAHQPGGIAQCCRLPVRGELSHDIDRCTGKMVCQHRNDRRRISPLAGLIDFLMLLGRSVEYIRQTRLHGVVDVAFAALAIDMHALLQQRIRSKEKHLMKCPMIFYPAAKILFLFALTELVQEFRKFFDVLVGHALYGNSR